METRSACIAILIATLGAARAHAQVLCEPSPLGTLGGLSAIANDINDWNQVVGRSQTLDRTEHAFVWERGKMRDLGSLDGGFSEARAINDWGTIVGLSAKGANAYVPVVWRRGKMAVLPIEGSGAAVDLNNRGQIVGTTMAGRCLLWEDGTSPSISLGTLGGAECYAWAISDAGIVVGVSSDAQGAFHAFVWRDGVMTQVEPTAGLPPEFNSSNLYDINSSGLAVGHLEGTPRTPFVWSPRGGARVLGLEGLSVRSVNDWGVIALEGCGGGDDRCLVLADKDGNHKVMGGLGSTEIDSLKLNNRFQLVWTAWDFQGFFDRAFTCRLAPPAFVHSSD